MAHNKHAIKTQPIDFEKLRSYFGWGNKHTIKNLNKTTQWAVASTRYPMRKHFKSRFSAFNIPWRSEEVAADTIFSDSPALPLVHHCNVPLGMLYGVSPDISVILLYTFYLPVFYATHNQSYPSVCEERAPHMVGFGEHVGDALIHKLLDDDTKKILYRSAVGPSDSAHPNKRLVPDGGESFKTPNPLSLFNLLPNPWQNTTMTLLTGPSYFHRMNK